LRLGQSLYSIALALRGGVQQTILALELADGFPTWQRLPLIIGFVSFVYGYVFFIVDYFVFMGFA
jgi:hypothetical protein